MDMINTLKKVPLFSELDEGELQAVANLASSIEVK